MRFMKQKPPPTPAALNLPDEIWTEIILLNLPFDSLVSLSGVCKAWRDLIRKNPYFIEKHINKNKNSDPLIFFRNCSKGIARDVTYSVNHPRLRSSHRRDSPAPDMKAIGSCSGVVCLVDPYTKEIHLCNPGTGEDRQLPRHNLRTRDNTFRMGFGFGFDASTKDYKVVVVIRGKSGVGFHASVYKLSTDCWIFMESICEDGVDTNGGHGVDINGVFLNGFYHWWVSGNQTILTFDFENDIFGSMQISNDTIGKIRPNYQCMGVLDDSLAICFNVDNRHSQCVDVWVMTEYGNKESWTKKFSVVLSRLWNVNSFWLFHDNMERLMMLGPHVEKLYLEVCSEKLSEKLLEIDGGTFRSGVFFRPSLVSLSRPAASSIARDYSVVDVTKRWLRTFAAYFVTA